MVLGMPALTAKRNSPGQFTKMAPGDLMRAYVSSTFLDLEDCREQVLRALSRIQVQGVAMESYVAAPGSPLERCMRDVAECDLYRRVRLALRIHPQGQDASITELEYRQAVKHGKPTLIFILNEDARWPPKLVDRVHSRDPPP